MLTMAADVVSLVRRRIPRHRLALVVGATMNTELAEEIARILGVELIRARTVISRSGEMWVQIPESIRGADVFIIASLAGPNLHEGMWELEMIIRALRDASVEKVIPVLPYFPYARQHSKENSRTTIGAKLFADAITSAGATGVVLLDMNRAQAQGFFNLRETDHIYGTEALLPRIKRLHRKHPDLVIVSPDEDGMKRAHLYARKQLGTETNPVPVALLDMRSEESYDVIGDVRGRTTLIVDDMVDEATKAETTSNILIMHEATEVYMAATHGVLSGNAIDRISRSPIKQLMLTNSVPIDAHACKKIVVVSVGPLLADVILRMYEGLEISSRIREFDK
ncbi:ribose-phosphate diphosphokinase [Candidatus Uhrbacteria bacterium]|nr:ribose-phosphate diphosphokinase [Candidatus Uhrbacteria bacterium]